MELHRAATVKGRIHEDKMNAGYQEERHYIIQKNVKVLFASSATKEYDVKPKHLTTRLKSVTHKEVNERT